MNSNDSRVLNAIFNPLLPAEEAETSDEVSTAGSDQTAFLNSEVGRLDREGIVAAEAKDLDRAIGCFARALEIEPDCAAVYNDRAYALQLKGDLTGAMSDLDAAIVLSQGKGKVASQAYTQRGLLQMRLANEAAAKEDFIAAAKLGSKFAKEQLVMLNPYAAMCNRMLQEAFSKLQRGEPEDSCSSEPPA